MMSFQILCERYNLPYFHFQMGNLFENMYYGLKPTESDRLTNPKLTDDDRVLYEPLKKNERDLDMFESTIGEYEDHINNFMNWPFSVEFGGGNMLDILQIDKIKELRVSELDDHPNEKGHKALSDELIKRMDKHGINNL